MPPGASRSSDQKLVLQPPVLNSAKFSACLVRACGFSKDTMTWDATALAGWRPYTAGLATLLACRHSGWLCMSRFGQAVIRCWLVYEPYR